MTETAPLSEIFYHCTTNTVNGKSYYLNNTLRHNALDLTDFYVTLSQMIYEAVLFI
jgi:hypothetical protein